MLKRLLLLIAVAACIGVVPVGGAAAQSDASPFDSLTVFCTKSTAPSGARNASVPGVTPSSITLADQSLDTVALKRVVGRDSPNYHAFYQALWDEVNRCGGINGRKVILKNVPYNALAVDQTGHQQAQCIRIAEDIKALLVSGITSNATARCTSILHKTIQLAPQAAGVTSKDFADSDGRILSVYPAADRLSSAVINDGLAEGRFKGRKIGVLGAATTATVASDLQKQYVDVFKAKGLDAVLEVLPCTGTNCTAGIGNAIRRLKGNDIEVLVLSQFMTSQNIGQVLREMRAQGLNVSITGPYNGSVMADVTLSTTGAAAGSDGLAFANRVGWTAVGSELVGEWRDGKIKETPFARMCLNLLAKATGQAPILYTEGSIITAYWGAGTNICAEVRAVARAIYSLGNNVTTARVAKALSTVKMDKRDTGPVANDKAFFSGADVAPRKVTTLAYRFPCPSPRSSTSSSGCFMPVDMPPRFRTAR
ncbi:MAG: hypothetical protein JWM05_1196 [Acidimicrobiales bacterium]|nr:hypothetical protein [Acidimicrobiales bacterium]